MSIFGYPASITHYQATLDMWNRVTGFSAVEKKAKVVEQQKLIRNDKGEEVQSIAEIHLEGLHDIRLQDYFEYVNALGQKVKYIIRHIEIKKNLGTDQVKKVIVYA
jgi:hypothetical protein